MSSVWDERAEAYRRSEVHRSGPDLDVLVEWAAGMKSALDVATGGGHVARRLREAGLEVVTCDPAPRMEPDVICPAEQLAFPDNSFDLVATRVAAHHFADAARATSELARVARRRVIIVDNLYVDRTLEEAERIRDPSHVRTYTEVEWRGFIERAGLRIEEVRRISKPMAVEPWLDRAGCEGAAAERVRALLTDRIRDGTITLDAIAVKAEKER